MSLPICEILSPHAGPFPIRGEAKRHEARMAIYRGTLGNDVINLFWHREGDTIFGDDDADPNAPPGDNVIIAGHGADTIHAGYGRDRVSGGAGDDLIHGYGPAGPSAGAVDAFAARDLGDHLDGGPGQDVILGGGGADLLLGGSGDDQLRGGSGDDIILGGEGNDLIGSGSGADRLWGGVGGDIFVYAYSSFSEEAADANGGIDTIMDFQPGEDRIDLRGYGLSEAAVAVTPQPWGLSLDFTAVYEPAGIHLYGVAALQAGDILFA